MMLKRGAVGVKLGGVRLQIANWGLQMQIEDSHRGALSIAKFAFCILQVAIPTSRYLAGPQIGIVRRPFTSGR
jgi:hypothetical protein